MAIPPALENLIRSDDGIDWPREVAPGVIVSITVREIRRNRTGLHGFIAVTNGHQIFGHDTFNLLRLEERHRLARRSAEHFGTLLSGAYPKENLAHDLDTLCMWLALEYESSQFEMEEVDPDTVVPPAQFLLDPYIVGNSGTILFGEPGAGKSYICQAMAVCLSQGINELWGITTPTPTVYINLERPERSMVIREQRLRSVLNIHGRTGVKYIHARGHGLPAVAPTVRKWSKENPHGLVILDSITRAALGDLKDNDTGNSFINAMNSLGCAWLGIGHSPRDNQEHIFGCHSADTEVFTRDGWKLHSAVTLDDTVACFDPDDNLLQWHQPTTLHEYAFQGEMVHLKGKMFDILVTPTHRMLVKHRTRANGLSNIYPSNWQWTTADNLKRNVRLPAVAPVMTGETPLTLSVGPAQLETEDFLAYLGWWLSEGSVPKKGGTVSTLTQTKGEIAQRMLATTQRLGFNPRLTKVTPKPREGDAQEQEVWHIATRYAPWFARWLTSHCGQGAPNKHLPPGVLGLAYHLRRILFDALMEGDGHWYEKGTGSYSTTSRQLANDFQALAVTLGIAASMAPLRLAGRSKHAQYVVYLRRSTAVGLTARYGNIQSATYDGMVYCLTVPTGAYLTRRNGKIAITGNSVMYDAGEDIGVQVRSELKGLTRGVALKMTKSNDTAFSPINYYALEFAEDNSGLTNIRTARKSEFPEMASSGPISRRQQIVNFLNDQPDGAASVKEIADGVEMSPSNVSPLMKDDPTFQSLPKEGRVRRYRVAVHTNSYDS